MCLIFIRLTAADPSNLGRLDYASLSTQTLMEIFIDGIENREVICGSIEEPADIDKWEGFEYTLEHPAEGVERHFKIQSSGLNLVGTIDLRWLPPTTNYLNVYDNELSGSTPSNRKRYVASAQQHTSRQHPVGNAPNGQGIR